MIRLLRVLRLVWRLSRNSFDFQLTTQDDAFTFEVCYTDLDSEKQIPRLLPKKSKCSLDVIPQRGGGDFSTWMIQL